MVNHSLLIQAIINGDKNAFRELYVIFSKKVYNTALSYTKNIEDAEEITQDVFVKVYNNASKFKGDSKLSTWIYRIVINTSLNYVKKKQQKSFFSFLEIIKEPPEFNHPGVY